MSDPTDGLAPDPPVADATPEPVAQPSPWAPWEQAGWDPTGANPYETRQAYDYYRGLQDRTQRDFYLERTLAGHELPEGMTWAEAKEAIANAHKIKSDPWAALDDGTPDETPYGEDFQVLDPRQIDQVIEARIEARLQAERQRQEQERLAESWQAEFGREYDRIRQANGLQDEEAQLVAAHAAALSQQNPGQPLSGVFDQAHNSYRASVERRLAEMVKQQGQAPATSSPASADAPAMDQRPSNLDDVRRVMQERFTQ